jgi:hypothetical protein
MAARIDNDYMTAEYDGRVIATAIRRARGGTRRRSTTCFMSRQPRRRGSVRPSPCPAAAVPEWIFSPTM